MFSPWRVEWLSPGCVWLYCCCCCEVTTLRGLICHGCYERLPSLSIRTPHFLIPIKKVIFTISFCHNCLTVNIFYRSGFDFSGQFQEQEFGSMSPQLSPGVGCDDARWLLNSGSGLKFVWRPSSPSWCFVVRQLRKQTKSKSIMYIYFISISKAKS